MNCDEPRIAEFVGGTLSPEEMSEVLDHLDRCPRCEETFRDLANFRALAPELHSRLAPEFFDYEKKPGSFHFLWKWAPAALLLGLVLGVALFRGWLVPAENWRDLLETEPFPYERSIYRDGATPPPTSRDQILTMYTGGEYEHFLPIAQAWLRTHPDDVQMSFLAGVASYMRGRFEEAVRFLAAGRSLRDGATPEAAWYLANAHLRLDHQQEARPLLDDLVRQKSSYAEQAARLLAALPSGPDRH